MDASKICARRMAAVPDRVAALILLAIGVIVADTGAVPADDSPLLITRLRHAVEDVVAHPLISEERFGFAPTAWLWEDRDVLATLGSAQVALNDLAGAEQTARAIFAGPPLSLNHELESRFFTELTIARGATGDVEAAYVLFKKFQVSVQQIEIDQSFTTSRVAMARALARAGRVETAKRVCEDTIRDIQSGRSQRQKTGGYKSLGWYEREGLFWIAGVQIQIGDMAGARRTRSIIETELDELSPQGEYSRPWWYPQLAELAWKLGDTKGATKIFERARSNSRPAFVNWRGIIRVEARQGDLTGARRDVAEIHDESLRNIALIGLTKDQARRSNLDFAEGIVHDNFDGSDIRDFLQVGLAKARAWTTELEKALAVAREIRSDVRRAQAILEIAAVLAKQDQKLKARRLAADLSFLREDNFGRRDARRTFDFDKPGTWSANYLFKFAGGINSMMYNVDIEGELLAAAVRCRVALDGPGSFRAIPAMGDQWDVRKAAFAQAGEGDARGALAWLDALPRVRRIAALVGAASGYAEYRRSLEQPASKEIDLDPTHFLSRRYGPADRDEDE
jgi:hypothetical protein